MWEGRRGAEPGRVLPHTSTALHKIQCVVECRCDAEFHTPPRMRLPPVSVRLGTATLVSQLPFPQLEFASFNFAWPVLSGLPRSCVHRRGDSTLESRPDLSDRFVVSSSFDSTVIQKSSCRVLSQQPWEMDDSVCRCRRSSSHCPLSPIGSAPSRLLHGTRVL